MIEFMTLIVPNDVFLPFSFCPLLEAIFPSLFIFVLLRLDKSETVDFEPQSAMRNGHEEYKLRTMKNASPEIIRRFGCRKGWERKIKCHRKLSDNDCVSIRRSTFTECEEAQSKKGTHFLWDSIFLPFDSVRRFSHFCRPPVHGNKLIDSHVNMCARADDVPYDFGMVSFISTERRDVNLLRGLFFSFFGSLLSSYFLPSASLRSPHISFARHERQQQQQQLRRRQRSLCVCVCVWVCLRLSQMQFAWFFSSSFRSPLRSR